MELRNLILLGNGNQCFQFLATQQLGNVPTPMLAPYSGYGGFYGEFGRPVHALIGGKTVSFWPDEWQRILGEQKAVGHFIQYQLENGLWVEGNIESYDPSTGMHTIHAKRYINPDQESSSDMTEEMIIKADLQQRPHLWVDLQNQQHLVSNANRLKFSTVDVSKFIRIWWSRYQRFYYGRVIAYDPYGKQHTIVYEDADSRIYDMTTKEYELIDAPLDVLRSTSGLSDAQASKIIAEWHRSYRNNVSNNLDISSQSRDDRSDSVTEKAITTIPRPGASTVLNLSSYQLEAINEYFQANGAENMFQSLIESSPPPSCRIMLLHLQLVYNLRQHIGAKRFRDFTWDLKEIIPMTLLRYDEQLIREFNMREFNDLLLTIRDLLNLASADLKESRKPDVQESLDLLRLSMAQKLLSSAKLQKRYQGLSIVKEVIDSLLPKLGPFLQKRRQTLKRGVASTTPAPRPYGNSMYNLKIVISEAKFDKWLKQSNIVDVLFGDSLHQDMISKADNVLVYMAYRHLLEEKHIQLIWQATKGAHEAIVRVTFHLLLVLLPAMDNSLRQFLFNLLSSMSYKEYNEQVLRLIQNFTLEYLRVAREEKGKHGDIFALSDNALHVEDNSNTNHNRVVSMPTTLNRKVQVVNGSNRQWMGFGLLWKFIQDSSEDANADPILIGLAVDLLVELLQEEFVEEREAVMQKCIDNVQLGRNVPISLQLLRRTLCLYPSGNKGWFILSRQSMPKGTSIAQQIEKLLKQSRLMEIFFAELERIHNQVGKAVTGDNGIAGRPRPKSRVAEVSKLKGIVERLDFLQFVLSKSCFKLSEAQALIVWQVFGEDSTSEEALDKLCIWLDGLVVNEHPLLSSIMASIVYENDPLRPDLNSQLSFLGDLEPKNGNGKSGTEVFTVLEENVVSRIFEDCILKLAYSNDGARALSRPAVASLAMKMFLLVNLNNKTLRFDNDGQWNRSGYLIGIPLLWRLALDADHGGVPLAAMKLLVELHHRIPKSGKGIEGLKAGFLKLCFKHLYHSMQALHSEESNAVDDVDKPLGAEGSMGIEKEKSRVVSTHFDANGKAEEWFEDANKISPAHVLSVRIARLVTTLQMFIHRWYFFPVHFHTIKVIAGNDDSTTLKLSCKSTDTIGNVRLKVAQHFKEDPSIILLQTSNSAADKLEKDDITIRNAKFGFFDSLYARKKDSPLPTSSEKSGDNPFVISDVITEKELEHELLDELDPLGWLGFGAGSHKSGNIFNMPPFPLRSSLKQYFTSDSTQPEKSIPSDRLEVVSEQLVPIIKANPHYIDQLLEMLDGYLSMKSEEDENLIGLSSVVWDIIQSLPFQVSLYLDIKNNIMEGDGLKLRALFDASCPYRLLYTLQMVDSLLGANQNDNEVQMLSIPSSSSSPADWAMKFFHLGGSEFVSELLNHNLVKSSAQPFPWRPQECGAFDYQVHRCDLYLLTSIILIRISSYLLAQDPVYRMWQCNRSLISKPTGDNSSDNIAPAVVLTCMDAFKLVSTILVACSRGCELSEDGKISLWVLESFIDHALGLSFGLTAAREDGLTLIQQTRFVEMLFRTCFECECNHAIQLAIARRCFEGCACIYIKCADPSLAQEKKPARVRLYDALVGSVISTALKDVDILESAQNPEKLESFYTLLAALECIRIAPEKAFTGLSLFNDVRLSLIGNSASFASVGGDNLSPTEAGMTSTESAEERRPLIQTFVKRLRNHSSRETFHSGQTDGELIGILRVLLVLSLEEENKEYIGGYLSGETVDTTLIEFLYLNCLYPLVYLLHGNESDEAKKVALCQTAESRSLAYVLLSVLCDGCNENLSHLAAAVNKAHPLPSQLVEKITSSTTEEENNDHSLIANKRSWLWDYDPSALLRLKDDYIGLCNQGGTCYMNSFIQQLFHIQSFTDGLLSISEYATENEFLNVLFQMQVMFGYLRLGQKRYYDTLPFCRSLIDYDGQPLSLVEQKDINEFAGMLFDKLERNPACADLLKRTIQGTLVWQTRSLETPYRSEREESFFMISAEVKDKRTLHESLELNVAEELFTGDNKIEDSDAGRKVDATRRCAIRSLPPTLIIHLKRFEFDLETMNRKKVNDFISFPHELDMFPYTEEGVATREVPQQQPLEPSEGDGDASPKESSVSSAPSSSAKQLEKKPDTYYHYTLKGIVAHVGAIDRGHYYSFVKDRRSNQWFEFNDRLVLPFNPDNIAKECFGGSEEVINASGATISRVRENNAYLLIYERKEGPVFVGGSSAKLAPNPGSSIALSSMATDVSPTTIAKRVEEAVWTENTEFQEDRFLFHVKHVLFYWKMLQIHQQDSTVPSWTLVTLRFLIDVLIRARARACIPVFFSKLEEIVKEDTTGQVALTILNELASTSSNNVTIHSWLVSLFQYCPHPATVHSFSRLLIMAFKASHTHLIQSPLPIIITQCAISPTNKSLAEPSARQQMLQQLPQQVFTALEESPVLMTVCKVLHMLLLVLETSSIEDILRKDGKLISTDLLYSDNKDLILLL
eukprot:scaffold96_cov167-Ochromonas_danica.AAC.25